jgi:anti-sigma B factor antagonist
MTAPAISVTIADDNAAVALRGEHESFTADKLTRGLNSLIDESLAITVDLSYATFIDSTVIGVLLAAARRAREHQLSFRLMLGQQTGWPVRRLLEVTGLETQFDVVNSDAGPP